MICRAGPMSGAGCALCSGARMGVKRSCGPAQPLSKWTRHLFSLARGSPGDRRGRPCRVRLAALGIAGGAVSPRAGSVLRMCLLAEGIDHTVSLEAPWRSPADMQGGLAHSSQLRLSKMLCFLKPLLCKQCCLHSVFTHSVFTATFFTFLHSLWVISPCKWPPAIVLRCCLVFLSVGRWCRGIWRARTLDELRSGTRAVG